MTQPIYQIGDDFVGDDGDSYQIGDDYEIGADDAEALQELFGDFTAMGDDNYEEVLGALEIMGAAKAQNSAANRLRAQALAKAAGGATVRTTKPKWLYNQILPCTSLSVGAGLPVDVELKPQRPFRPDFYRASSYHSAPYFTVSQYAIGQENQFVAAGNIPLDLFSEVSVNSGTQGQTANLGNTITLTFNNISDATRSLRSAFFGKTLLPG